MANAGKQIWLGTKRWWALSAGLILLGCNYASVDDAIVRSTTAEKMYELTEAPDLYQLQLASDLPYNYYLRAFHPLQTWLSFSYSPLDETASVLTIEAPYPAGGLKVRPSRTPWASAWDREEVVRELNNILISHGIDSTTVRVRMIAHAIVASGWKQNVWNFNAWGVQQGSWDKNWYVMPTYEEDDYGHMIYVEDAAWRAFSDWAEAIQDFQERISPDSDRPAYREAYSHLVNETASFRVSEAYWEALGAGNYYTASKFTGKKFARLCGSVRATLNASHL